MDPVRFQSKIPFFGLLSHRQSIAKVGAMQERHNLVGRDEVSIPATLVPNTAHQGNGRLAWRLNESWLPLRSDFSTRDIFQAHPFS